MQPVDLKLPVVLFTDPDRFEEEKKDKSLISQIEELINATPPGEEISVCVFKFEIDELAESFINAQERGVKVRVIINKGKTSKEANQEVKDLLKSKLEDFHYIENNISNKGIIHNKFIIFSRVETTRGQLNHVVLQTSSNFQKKGTRKLQDMVIISSPEIYFGYLDFWYEIKVLGRADKLKDFNYFNSTDLNQGYKAYFFPKRKNEEDYGSDNVVKALKNIGEPSGAEVRFAHGKWGEKRDDIIKELENLREKGALVEVVTNRDIEKEIKNELKDLEKGVYYLDESFNLHTKFFLMKDGDKKQVWTGSHNLTERSLRENFEVLLMINDPGIYEAYLQYFIEIKSPALGTIHTRESF